MRGQGAKRCRDWQVSGIVVRIHRCTSPIRPADTSLERWSAADDAIFSLSEVNWGISVHNDHDAAIESDAVRN